MIHRVNDSHSRWRLVHQKPTNTRTQNFCNIREGDFGVLGCPPPVDCASEIAVEPRHTADQLAGTITRHDGPDVSEGLTLKELGLGQKLRSRYLKQCVWKGVPMRCIAFD